MSKKNYTVAIVVFVIAENKNRFAFSLTVLMLLLHVWFSADWVRTQRSTSRRSWMVYSDANRTAPRERVRLGWFGFCFFDYKLSFLYLIRVRLGLHRWNQIAQFLFIWFGHGLGLWPMGSLVLKYKNWLGLLGVDQSLSLSLSLKRLKIWNEKAFPLTGESI